MRRTILTVTAAVTIGVSSGGGAGPAGAQPAGCAPGDVGCALVEELERGLAPAPPATGSPGSPAPSTTAGEPVAAAAAEGTTAELAADAARIPAVPVGQALELPPLTIPDFGGAPAPATPVARAVRPVRSQAGDALTGLATSGRASDTGGVPAAAVALGVPAVLAAVSVLARRARA